MIAVNRKILAILRERKKGTKKGRKDFVVFGIIVDRRFTLFCFVFPISFIHDMT